MGSFQDLTGMTFNRLTVIERADDGMSKAGNRKTRWKCRCECGNICIIDASHLKCGHTQSCGCFHQEQIKKERRSTRKSNRYVVNNGYVTGYTNHGVPFFVDTDDYEKISQYCWSLNGNGYLGARGPRGEHLLLHRIIMGTKPGELVDHINHDLMDNRKCNLRIVFDAENRLNTKLRRNNTSGVTGVYANPDGTWFARITRGGKDHFLGRFSNYEDAVAARKSAEKTIFGEYSYDSSVASVPRVGAASL